MGVNEKHGYRERGVEKRSPLCHEAVVGHIDLR